jgi:DNA-nicking Smr family endonuclease
MTGRRRRVVSEAELALWTKVVESVKPMPGRRRAKAEPPEAAVTPAEPPAPEKPQAAPKRLTPPPPSTPAAPKPPPLALLEPRMRRRIARGVVAVDARIDLHGLRQDEAHRRLASFLLGAQAGGARVVLVITGKGRPAAEGPLFGEERGVLRRSVPLWLSSPAARHVVIGYEEADPVHGGGGALYVRIRKAGLRR